VAGWSGASKGRIWRVTDPAQQEREIVAETRELLGGDWSAREVGELERLLGHADMRARMEAQFELVRRGVPGMDALERAAKHGKDLERLHGVWGLGQAARRDPDKFKLLAGLAADDDAEVRTQLFRVLDRPADGREPPSWFRAALASGLRDASDRVAASAALAAGRVREPSAFPPLMALAARASGDPLLRHAVAMGLAGCALEGDLAAYVRSHDPTARLLAVLALRHNRDPALARFLQDRDARVVLEAARAIHDLPVPGAMDDLAALLPELPAAIDDTGLPGAHEGGPESHDDADALVRRVLNANDRIGENGNGLLLMGFAASDTQRPAHRRFALEMLAEWKESPRRDRVLGDSLPVRARDVSQLPDWARALGKAGLPQAEDDLAGEWLRLVAASAAADLEPEVTAILDDDARSVDLRVVALHTLADLAPPDLPAIVDRTLSARDARLRAEALAALEKLSPEAALPRALPLLAQGELSERRVAYGVLGRAQPTTGLLPALGDDEQREVVVETLIDPASYLAAELARLESDLVPVELRLDLVLAAEARHDEALDGRLQRWRAPRAMDPELASWLDSLFGGDSERGREIYDRPSLNCGKCHARDEYGSQVVGPNLQGVGRRLARLHILESIVVPNRRIAPGFGSELLFLRGAAGRAPETLACRVLEDDAAADVLKVSDHEGRLRLVPRADIELRKLSLSAMPEGLAAGVTREEMRDLLEYLAGL
jgi:quinoprotein glucose dehydrogenase